MVADGEAAGDEGLLPRALVRFLKGVLEAAFALTPSLAIGYIALFQDPALTFEDHLFHETAIGLSILLGGLVAYVTWRCYLATGEPFLRWLTLGFVGFTALYAFHGLFTPIAAHHLALFLLYGPASRLLLAACMLVGMLQHGHPPEPPQRRRRAWHWLPWLALFALADLLVAALASLPVGTGSGLRLGLELGSAALCLATLAIMLRLRLRSPLFTLQALAIASFAQSSIAFVLAKPWNHQWWLAHGIFAAGFLLLSYGVLRAYLTSRSFSRVYSEEELFERLERSNTALRDALGWAQHANTVIGQQAEVSRRAKDEFESLFELAPDGVLVVAADGRLLKANSRAAELFGYAAAELQGLAVEALMPDEHRAAHLGHRGAYSRAPTTRAMNPQRPLLAQRRDGSRFFAEIGLSPLRFNDEPATIAVVRDITARRQAESALRESEQRFHQLFDHAPIGMAIVGLDLRIRQVNLAMRRLSGYEEAELTAMSVSDITHPADLSRDSTLLARLMDGSIDSYEIEKRHLRRDGTFAWVLLNRAVIRDETGLPICFIAQVQDINERKQAAARIERLSRLYAAISEINMAIVRSSRPGEVFQAACRACVDFGGLRLAWVGLANPQTGLVEVAETYGPAKGYTEGLVVAMDAALPQGGGPTALAWRESRVVIANDFQGDPRTVPWRERAAAHGLFSSISLPIHGAGKPIGALTAYGDEPGFFDDEGVALLQRMAENISFAMDQFDRDEQRRRASDALRRNALRLHEAQSLGRIGDWEFDLADNRMSWSPEVFRLFERDPDDGEPDFAAALAPYLPESAQSADQGARQVLQSGERVDLELQARLPSGRLVHHAVVMTAVRELGGQVTRIRGTVQDVSERKQAEQTIREFAREIEDLYQNAPCGYHSIDAEGHILRINDTELKWLGYARDEVIGRLCFVDLLTPASRHHFETHFDRFKTSGSVNNIDLELVRKDGTMMPVMASATAVRDAQGRYFMSRATLHDATERKRMERERAEHAQRVEALSRRLVAIQEEERRRLSSDLHDRTSPNLAAISIALGALVGHLPRPRGEDAQFLCDDIGGLLQDATASIREICADLRTPVLDYGGLRPALEDYAKHFAGRSGIAVKVATDGLDQRLPGETESLIFRIVQEALTNSAKHARAGTIHVDLRRTEDRTVLTITDDGVGFDPDELGLAGAPPGIGLLTMRERAEFAGGRFSLQSRPGQGTRIRVEI